MPNIFEYATSELSQDAFLCYLLSFAKKDYEQDQQAKEEYDLACSFLSKCGINETVEKILIQEKYVDVLLLTKSYAIIIEDKKFTTENNNQIKRYIDKITKKYPNKNIKAVYFKSGYTSIQEKEKLKEIAQIFSLEEIISLINTYKGKDMIINMWKENIEKTYQEINAVYDKIEKLKNIMICPDNLTPLQQDVYLDELTQNFKSDFSAVSWYRSGQGRTPHICFEDVEIYSSGKCQIKVGIYLMLRKSLHIVVKQHLYKSPDNRIKLNEYNKYPEEKQKLLEKQYKLQNSVIKSDWEKKNNDKDKLTILSKPTTDDIKECIADIKDLQQLVSKLKE